MLIKVKSKKEAAANRPNFEWLWGDDWMPALQYETVMEQDGSVYLSVKPLSEIGGNQRLLPDISTIEELPKYVADLKSQMMDEQVYGESVYSIR